jgi:hypothetical protein
MRHRADAARCAIFTAGHGGIVLAPAKMKIPPPGMTSRHRAMEPGKWVGRTHPQCTAEAEAIYRNYRRNLKTYTYFSG